MRHIAPEALQPLLPVIDSETFDLDVLERAGVFVLRKALPRELVEKWQSEWREFYKELSQGRQINPRNTAIVYEQTPPTLTELYKCPQLLDIVEKVHGSDIAFYFQRFLLKDSTNPDSVFLHQDFGYNTGWPDKINIFIPLNKVGPENGGLTFYPGTHYYGYLGDIGTIDPDAYAPGIPTICPTIDVCDVVLMHQCTWHGSGPYQSGPERALVQVCYQPTNDPTGVELLRGKWNIDRVTGVYVNQKLFKRSRIQRLIELQAIADKHEGKKE